MERARVFLMLLLVILAPAGAWVGKGDGTLHVPDAYAASSEAPTTQWIKTYGEANTGAEAHSVVQTSDGGYALTGFIVRAGDHFWLVKTDSTGTMQWSKTYGGAGSDQAFSVVQTSDGGYALAGYTDSFGAGSNDAWLVKTDSSGAMQWNKTYGGANSDGANSVVQTGDEGYALAGTTHSFGAGSFWLVRTDAIGNVEWSKTYGEGGYEPAFSLVQTRDEGYAAAGAKSLRAGGYEIWLVKTDSEGNAQWNQTYGGASNDWGFSVVQTADGGYAVAGRMTRPLPDLRFDFGLVKVAGENASSPTGFDWNSAEGYVVVGVVIAIATVAVWLVLVRRRRAKGPDDEKV